MEKCIFKPVYTCWVAEHPDPIGTIEFLGGALFGSLPQISYSYFLSYLYGQGYSIVTAPFRLGLNHQKIAEEIHSDRARVFDTLKPVHQELPRFWIGHSLGCKYIVLLESTGEEDSKSFLLKDQPSILLAPDVSNTYDAVKIGVIAQYLDDIGQGVNPDRARLAAILAASNRFNLTAIISFEQDDVAGNQAQSAEAPDFSDVALISGIIESRPSRVLLKAELADCKHLEPVGIQVMQLDGSLALVDLDLTDGFLEPVRDRLLEPKVVELLSQLKLKLATVVS
jgi:Protein of unknown function (DUF1350)